jgi:hypothetical protein
MLENKRIISSVERESIRALDRKCYRELKYEMDPYEWTLTKLPNGKTKAIVVGESQEYKDWRIDDKDLKVLSQIIAKDKQLWIVLKYKVVSRKCCGNLEHIQRNYIFT